MWCSHACTILQKGELAWMLFDMVSYFVLKKPCQCLVGVFARASSCCVTRHAWWGKKLKSFVQKFVLFIYLLFFSYYFNLQCATDWIKGQLELKQSQILCPVVTCNHVFTRDEIAIASTNKALVPKYERMLVAEAKLNNSFASSRTTTSKSNGHQHYR